MFFSGNRLVWPYSFEAFRCMFYNMVSSYTSVLGSPYYYQGRQLADAEFRSLVHVQSPDSRSSVLSTVFPTVILAPPK